MTVSCDAQLRYGNKMFSSHNRLLYLLQAGILVRESVMVLKAGSQATIQWRCIQLTYVRET